MKFLLIKPGVHKSSDIFSIYEPSIHPPLGLLYLGGILEQEGHEVEILDYNMENVPREQLKNFMTSSDAVGMTIYSNDYMYAQNISRTIKEIDPEIPLIIGAPRINDALVKKSISLDRHIAFRICWRVVFLL